MAVYCLKHDSLKKLSDREEIMIFPGFWMLKKWGYCYIFQGGSDISGSILAAAVNAEVYENFTDVDSFAADPKMVEIQPIPVFTYKEMRSLHIQGFQF